MRVLISAPYMVRERNKVEPLLSHYPVEVIWADVAERLEEHDLIRYLNDVQGIICGDDRFSGRVYDHAKSLKVVVKWGTGIDSICKEEAEKRQIQVFRTADAFTEPVADSTLGYILAYCRNLIGNDRILKSGGWHKPQGYAMREMTVGIIGLGTIGIAVAKRLHSFGARLLAYDTADISSELIRSYGIEMVSKEYLLQHSHVITLHCDLNPSSHHCLNSHAFKAMRLRPFIINTARGPLIDEPALVEALKQGIVSGAGLDVFDHEPLPLDSPLRSMENVLLAAHNSNSSPSCWDYVHRNSVNMLVEALKLAKR